MSRVLLSEKHGVNPTIPTCFVCGEHKNQIILMGRIKGDVEAPRNMCFDREPCDKCKEYMAQGIILISVRDSDEGSDNPYRTGGWTVIKEEAIRRIVTPKELADHIVKVRMCFVPDKVWDQLGLPRGEVKVAS